MSTDKRTRTFLGDVDEGLGRPKLKVYADLRMVDDLNDPDRTRQTTDHRTVRAGDYPSVAVTWEYGTARELARGDGSGGAGIDASVISGLPLGAQKRAQRILELAERWHLNDMTPGCIHQGDAWTCTRGRMTDPVGTVAPGCMTLNGWPEVRRLYGEYPYPQRGDACHKCDRNRWDEPTDHCPETGYRYGTAWLLDVPRAEDLEDLRRIFGATPWAPVPVDA